MGGCLGLGLLKFGNPVILDYLVPRPQTAMEWVYESWPLSWGYGLLIGAALVALKAGFRRPPAPPWLVWLPLGWWLWELIASLRTVDSRLTGVTLAHFAACILWFYLGLLVLNRAPKPALFWTGILAGFALVIWFGFGQHYGGLEATRRFVYQQPNWRRLPPEYLKRLAENRVFSTLVYPNALAGIILLLLPPLSVGLWHSTRRLGLVGQGVLTGTLVYSAIACLVWSGSKAGWLIGLLMLGVSLLRLPLPKRVKRTMLVAGIILGLAGFWVRYRRYFERGATSVVARFDYWDAAVHIAAGHPVFGTGPGTFSVEYRRLKSPGSEMALLTHNDYLEQASDSGFPGFLAYSALIITLAYRLYRKTTHGQLALAFAAWLGLFGWAVQGLVEFGLYIPASAWLAFALWGWLLGLPVTPNSIDTRPPAQ